MNDLDIAILKEALRADKLVIWSPDDSTAIRIFRIGPPPKEEVPEPSECAYTARRDHYIALYNALLSDFVVGERMGQKPKQTPPELLYPPTQDEAAKPIITA